MNNKLIVGLGIVGVIALGALMVIGTVISTSNQEVALRTTIETKQRDNTSELDNTIKKIGQSAQVTTAQKEALKEIIVGNAQARSSKGGSLALFVKEAVPNIDTSVFNNLMNVITSSRDAFTQRQKELLDLSREHNNLMRRFPSGVILSLLGRKEIPVQIVTSTRTTEAFSSGKDDDTKVFE